MAAPTKDSLLAPYSTNFNTRLVASPTTYNVSVPEVAAYTAVHTPYLAAYTALVSAREAGTRSESLTATKESCKAALLPVLRQLYKQIQADLDVADADKVLLGVHLIPDENSPIPAPTTAPVLEVESIYGRNVHVAIHEFGSTKKARPQGTAGALVYSFMGTTPPAETAGWESEGLVTKSPIIVQFPAGSTPGSKVWITAAWVNPRGIAGPACTPIPAMIGMEGAAPISA